MAGANAFAIAPSLSEPFPRQLSVWTDPITGLEIPKDPAVNLQWRADLLAAAKDDPAFQQDLFTASAKSILFWINAFGYSLRIFEIGDEGKTQQAEYSVIPYVTWEIQDKHILAIEDAINNAYSLLTDKSRDMGASWDHVFTIHHQFLFRSNSLFLELSRVESDVDDADNPRCLFKKHDIINEWLPEWMRPPVRKLNMHRINLANGSRIDGESSNKAAGSGDRRRAVLLDEMAKMENARKIRASLRDVSPCLLPNSTAWGAGTAYSEWRLSGKVKTFVLPWWEHPEKGRGRYVQQDEVTGRHKIRSPWYDAEDAKRSPEEMAQEVDMDHIGSGSTFFDQMVLEEHMHLFGREAKVTRAIDFRKTVATDAIPELILRRRQEAIRVARQGPWRIWINLVNGRPDQTKTYVFGIDISKGQGASNSVVAALCVETREVVAEFADANTPPYDLARIVCAAAIWFGGAHHGGRPFLIWEAQGPGWDFGRQLVKILQYPFYFMDREARTVEERRTRKYGWHSTNEKKQEVLGVLRRAYAHGGVVHHSVEALEEAKRYIEFEGGGIGPAELMEESPAARKTHGDRVIATALASYAAEEVAPGRRTPQAAPPRSWAYRRTMRLKQVREAKRNRVKRFDWRITQNAS